MKYSNLVVMKVLKKSDILVIAMSDSKKMIKALPNNRFTLSCFYHNDKKPSMSVDRDGWNRLWPIPLCQRTDHWYANMLLPMFFPADDGNFPEKVCPAWRLISFALLQYPRTERCNDLLKRKRSLISVSWQGMV